MTQNAPRARKRHRARNGLLVFIASLGMLIFAVTMAAQPTTVARPNEPEQIYTRTFTGNTNARVLIKAKFVEITRIDTRSTGIPLIDVPFLALSSNATPAMQAVTFSLSGCGTNSVEGIRSQRANILTAWQTQTILQGLNRSKGIELIAAPELTTVSGREGQIQLTDDPQTLMVPSLNIVPQVSPDGATIQLTVTATINEFLGYDDPGPWGEIDLNNQYWPKLPKPKLRTHKFSVRANVWDGQTLALGGMIADDLHRFKDKVPALGDLPIVGRKGRRETVNKDLIVLVTPTLLDAAGNQLHTEEELALTHKTVPPQAAGAPAKAEPQR